MKCNCHALTTFFKINKINYEKCLDCQLLMKKDLVSEEAEKRRYDMHVIDVKYYDYMYSIHKLISPHLIKGDSLDYGCGKEHVLADILKCDYYDLYYFPFLPNKKYANIILIEVFEHLKDPYNELIKLRKMLAEKGRIIIMTKPYDEVDLEKWWYLRDVTHICFIKKNTLAKWNVGLRLIYQKNDIFVLERI